MASIVCVCVCVCVVEWILPNINGAGAVQDR